MYSSESKSTSVLTYTYKATQQKPIDTTLDNTKLPASVFNCFESKMPEVATIISNLKSTISSYIDGDISTDEIKNSIEQTYADILNYNVSLGRTSGTNEEDNAHILSCVYQQVVTTTNTLCQMANAAEGNAIAAQKGMIPTDPFVYYNSKYCYAFEDIKQAAKDTTTAIASQQGMIGFNTAQIEKTTYTPDNWDFNTYWSDNVKNNKKICTMLDTSIAPPKDFVMFYSQSTEYADKVFTGGDISKIDDGELTIYSGDKSYSYTIPFDYYSDNVKETFNASDIITENDNGYSDYLKNFWLYRYYLHG